MVHSSWLKWCRLCAKQEKHGQENDTIFDKNDDTGQASSSLTTSIGKYFWVNIKVEDEISRCICKECRKLVDELSNFSERVNKVQTLFCLLQNLKPESEADANKLRTQFGIAECWEHIIKEEQRIIKPTNVNQEVQTDLVIFFNNNCGSEINRKSVEDGSHIRNEKDIENPVNAEEEQIVMDIEQVSELQTFEYMVPETRHKNVSEESENLTEEAPIIKTKEVPKKRNQYKKQIVMDIEQESHFEYLVQHDDDLLEIDENVYRGKNTKYKVHAAQEGAEDEADMEDSDLFKELKFKVEGNDANEAKTEENSQKGDSVEYHEIQLEDENGSEGLEFIEMEDDEDYEDDNEEIIETFSKTDEEPSSISNAFDLIKRKRGRPALTNKTGKRTSSVYRYECVECKRKYKSPTVYRKHMQSTHDVIIEHMPDLECPVCQKYCYNQSRLKLHMRQHLPDEEKLLVSCPYCPRKFSQACSMRQHVNGIHRDLKPYICDQCGRACKTLAALNEHQLVHTDECPFQCDVCQKGFKNKARLKSHQDTHNKSEYTCPDCGLKLNTKRTLLQHRLVHSNVKRFKCEFCDAAFKRSKSLKNHLILHSGLRPYKCQFCDRSFSNGSNCRSHKLRVHPKELAEEEAMGKKNEPVPIPKLEDLKAAKTAVVQPRKVKRQEYSAQFRKKNDPTKQNSEDSDDPEMDSYEMSHVHYEIKGEVDEDDLEENQDDDGCEETVIYEIIDEI